MRINRDPPESVESFDAAERMRKRQRPYYRFEDPDPLGFGDLVRARSDLLPRERELYEVLDLIVSEFESDPMSVQYFDLRTVERAKQLVARYRKLKG